MSEPRIFHLMQRAHSALFRASDSALRERHAIGSAQQAVLFFLSKHNGAPISQLAEVLHMRKSSVTGLVDRMEKAALVRREINPGDGRSMLLFLEPKGGQLATATLPATRSMNQALIAPFTDQEQRTIERFLRHIADSAETIVSDPEHYIGATERCDAKHRHHHSTATMKVSSHD